MKTLSLILALIEDANGEVDVTWRHYSNHAVHEVIGDKCHELSYSYEDNNIRGDDNAVQIAKAVEMICPGAYVWIKTGEYIAGKDYNPKLSTYDPNYYRLAVPLIVFDGLKDRLNEVEKQWRDAAEAKARGEVAS